MVSGKKKMKFSRKKSGEIVMIKIGDCFNYRLIYKSII